MKRKFNKYMLPGWVHSIKRVCGQFIIPICIFQGIRTILLPSVFDVILFTLLIILAISIYLEII